MIFIRNGGFQGPDGTPLAGGLLMLQLSADAQALASDVQVISRVPISIVLDGNGNAPTTAIWGNAELTPTDTFYLVNLYNSPSGGVCASVLVNPVVWVFAQPMNTIVDLGSMPL